MNFKICNYAWSTSLAVRPTGNRLDNRWVAVLLMLYKREKSPNSCNSMWLALQPQLICTEKTATKCYVHLCLCLHPLCPSFCFLSLLSILSPLSSCCHWVPGERERETLQCRHSNNLSPSDQLVWAMVWVADPAASRDERLTHHGVEWGVAWETGTGDQRGWMAMK